MQLPLTEAGLISLATGAGALLRWGFEQWGKQRAAQAAARAAQVETSETVTLAQLRAIQDESAALREELRDEVRQQRAEITSLRTEITTLRAENAELRVYERLYTEMKVEHDALKRAFSGLQRELAELRGRA